jgi:hypothetical protein
MSQPEAEPAAAEPVKAAKSCFVFAPDSAVRVRCLELLESRHWGDFIRFWTLTNCMALAFQAARIEYQFNIWDTLLIVYNAMCSAVFVFELVVKCIAHGFLRSSGDVAYLRDAGNWLDLWLVAVKSVSDFCQFTQSLWHVTSLFACLRAVWRRS